MRSVYFLLKLIGVALLSIILSVGIIGVSYSYFTGANEIRTDASMGNIDVVFSNLNIVQESTTDPSCVTQARIVDNGKHIEINIENADQGYASTIYYEVTNNGSVPVVFQLTQPYGEGNSPVQLSVSADSEYICRDGGQAYGQIVVKVNGKIDQSNIYSLYTELNFQQAVVEIS